MITWLGAAAAAAVLFLVALASIHRLGRKRDEGGRRPPDDRYPLF